MSPSWYRGRDCGCHASYALRWMRLLFGREFPIPESLLVWDSMLSARFGKVVLGESGSVRGTPESLITTIESIAVAMVGAAACLGARMCVAGDRVPSLRVPAAVRTRRLVVGRLRHGAGSADEVPGSCRPHGVVGQGCGAP